MSISKTPALCKAAKPVIRGLNGQMPDHATLDGWWSQTGSNRRPEACKATALPTELWPRPHPHIRKLISRPTSIMVGLGRFELPTSRLSSARSNQLSYRPLFLDAQLPLSSEPTHPVLRPREKEKRRRRCSANGPVTFRPYDPMTNR